MASLQTSVFPNTSITRVGGQNALEEKTYKKRVIVVLKKIATPQPLAKISQNSAHSSAQSSAKNIEPSSQSSTTLRPEELQKNPKDNDDDDEDEDNYEEDDYTEYSDEDEESYYQESDPVNDDDFSLIQPDVCQRCRNKGYYTCRCHQYENADFPLIETYVGLKWS